MKKFLQKLLGYETKKAYSTANCLSLHKMEEWQIAGKVPILIDTRYKPYAT